MSGPDLGTTAGRQGLAAKKRENNIVQGAPLANPNDCQ
jgi:hypothetical protein